MNKSTEENNIGNNDVSNEQDAELSEEALAQISSGKSDGYVTARDALLVINHLPSTSSQNVRFTHKEFKRSIRD